MTLKVVLEATTRGSGLNRCRLCRAKSLVWQSPVGMNVNRDNDGNVEDQRSMVSVDGRPYSPCLSPGYCITCSQLFPGRP